MTKAQAYAQWRANVVRYRGRYYTQESERWVRATPFFVFWRTVQRLNRLARSDPGGDITL